VKSVHLIIALLAAMSLPNPGQSAAIATPCSTGPSLDVDIGGLKDRTGRIVVELYPANEADFLRDKAQLLKEGKLFRRMMAPVSPNGPTHICVTAPSPGTYAMVVIHDRDGQDKFSIKNDGVALPKPQALGMSRPRVKQASVEFANSPRLLRVHMQYLRGMKGFVPSGR